MNSFPMLLFLILLSCIFLFWLIKILVEKPEFNVYVLFGVIIFPYEYLIDMERSYILTHLFILFLFCVTLSLVVLGRKISWDRVGLFYFCFLVFCLLNLLIGGLYVSEKTFLTMFHIYVRLVEGFLIYLLSFNVIKTEHQLGVVCRLSLVVVLFTSGYFIWENLYIISNAKINEFSADRFYQAFYTTQLRIFRGDMDVGLDGVSAIVQKLWSWLGGSNDRAAFSVVLCSFALGLVDLKKSLVAQSLLVCSLCVGIISIMLQISISAIVICSLILLVYGYRNRHLLLNRRIVLLKLSFILSLAVSLVLINPLLLNKISVYLDSGGSSSHRIVLVGEALDAAARMGFMGNGFDSVARASEWYEEYSLLSPKNTHNAYLEILLDGGLLGLMSFLAVLFYTYKNAKWLESNGSGMRSGQFGIACQLMLISMALTFLTSHGQLKNITFFGVFWILMGCCNRLKLDQEKSVPELQNQKWPYNPLQIQGRFQAT